MDPVIFNTLRRIRSENDEDRQAELKAQSNAALATHFSSAQHEADLQELAFDVLDSAWRDALKEDITQRVIEVKTVGLGDVDYIEEDLYGMRAYWQGKGGQIRSDIIRYERLQMPREEMVAAIDMHQDEMATDFWGPMGKLVGQAQDKMRALPVERLVELVQAAITSGNYYGTFARSSLTAAQVDGVLENVALRSDGQVTIMGTRYAIRGLAGIGLAFGDNIQEEIFKTGLIGQYKGYAVVQVDNSEDFDGNVILPNDELWLVGKRAGRLTYFGGTPKVQTLRRPSFYQRWETARDAGMLLYGADKGRIGRIKLT